MNTKSKLTPVLMLVPYFAPQSHAAMFRAHKLAKYLPEYGYKPIIVTTDTNYLYNEDDGLLAELPPEVEIHRARYIEPTLRGLRMALGGTDRRFVTLKAEGKVSSASTGRSDTSNQKRKLPNAGSAVANLIGNWPDRYWTWSGPAGRLSQQLIAQHGIQLLYTSANPVSFLRAAIRLRQRNDLTWLFDSRDPLGYGQKHTARTILAREMERRILKTAMGAADHISGLSASYGQIFFDLFGVDESKWSFIPTGLDEAYVPKSRDESRGRNLLHVGEVMPNQSPDCFKTLEKILEQSGDAPPFDKLQFVGRREVNEPIVSRMIADLPLLKERVIYLDHRSQSEVYKLMRKARACLLVPGPSRYWWNNFAKLVDYIGLATPVIAHVPAVSEARHELEQAGTAFFLESDIRQDAHALGSWLSNGTTRVNSDYCRRYTAKRQVSEFAKLFDRILAERGVSQR
jgi:glycosyltransferase involved in cell wall biosynthesis